MDEKQPDHGLLGNLLLRYARASGLEHLEFDPERHCILEFRGDLLSIEQDPDGSTATVMTDVGVLPPDTPAAALREILASNLLWRQTEGATLSLEPKSGTLVLALRFGLATLDLEQFDRTLSEFLNNARGWRERFDSPAWTEVTQEATFSEIAANVHTPRIYG